MKAIKKEGLPSKKKGKSKTVTCEHCYARHKSCRRTDDVSPCDFCVKMGLSCVPHLDLRKSKSKRVKSKGKRVHRIERGDVIDFIADSMPDSPDWDQRTYRRNLELVNLALVARATLVYLGRSNSNPHESNDDLRLAMRFTSNDETQDVPNGDMYLAVYNCRKYLIEEQRPDLLRLVEPSYHLKNPTLIDIFEHILKNMNPKDKHLQLATQSSVKPENVSVSVPDNSENKIQSISASESTTQKDASITSHSSPLIPKSTVTIKALKEIKPMMWTSNLDNAPKKFVYESCGRRSSIAVSLLLPTLNLICKNLFEGRLQLDFIKKACKRNSEQFNVEIDDWHAFGGKISVCVTLLTNEIQHVLSGFGTVQNIPTLPLKDSICRFNLTPGSFMSISNLADDEKYNSSTYVESGGLRSYAGYRSQQLHSMNICMNFKFLKYFSQNMLWLNDVNPSEKVSELELLEVSKLFNQKFSILHDIIEATVKLSNVNLSHSDSSLKTSVSMSDNTVHV